MEKKSNKLNAVTAVGMVSWFMASEGLTAKTKMYLGYVLVCVYIYILLVVFRKKHFLLQTRMRVFTSANLASGGNSTFDDIELYFIFVTSCQDLCSYYTVTT